MNIARNVGLSLRTHPISFWRETLTKDGIAAWSILANARDGVRLTVAGVVLVRQSQGSAKGVTFITIEDENCSGICRSTDMQKIGL